jgi:hypothetical protein
MYFYADYPESGVFEPRLQQGDILYPLPFTAFRISEAVKLVEEADDLASFDVIDLTSQNEQTGKILVAYGLQVGIVVSQSCDIERGNRPILVAPVRPFGSVFPDTQIGSKGFKEKIQTLSNPGKNPTSFPLPRSCQNGFNFPYSLVIFFEMQSIPPDDLGCLCDLVKLRLSPLGLGKFQERLAFLFGRFAAPDDLFFAEEHR